MKTNLQKLFLLAITLFVPGFVKAASSCSYSEQVEMNDIVANVKASYEVVDIYDGQSYDVNHPDENGDLPLVDHYVKGFRFSILNITEDIYVKVINNYNDDAKIYKYADTENGIATFQTKKKDKLYTYTIEVYSNKYSCAGEKFRTFTITTPAYNYFSEYLMCDDYPDFYYCQEFLTSGAITQNEFIEKMTAYKEEQQKEKQEQEEKNKSIIEKIKEFYNNNKVLTYSIIIVIIVTGVATTVILIKKKRSRVL